MLNRLFITLFIISLNPIVVAETIASWIPLEGLTDSHVVKLQQLRKSRCLPEKKLSKYPVFPKAFVVGLDWGALAPNTPLLSLPEAKPKLTNDDVIHGGRFRHQRGLGKEV